ncbi:MAG: TolC family protein [bacterium]|nr:TolC family protein [bacterium]
MSASIPFFRISRWLVLLIGCVLLAGHLDSAPGEQAAESTPADAPVIENEERSTLLKRPRSIPIGVRQAIVMALGNNPSVALEKLNPLIVKTLEEAERGSFDPTLFAESSLSRSRKLIDGQRTDASRDNDRTSEDVSESAIGTLGAEIFLPTGTSIALSLDAERTIEKETTYGNFDDPILTTSALFDNEYSTRAGITISQALLRGFSIEANLAALKQARIDTDISRYQLRGFIEEFVARVENAYWNLALQQRRVGIVEDGLRLAEQQFRETEETIKRGRLAGIELAKARAEVAQRRIELIEALGDHNRARLQQLQLIQPEESDFWELGVFARDRLTVPDVKLDPVKEHVAVAHRMRNDLREAVLRQERNELEVTRTRNGVLPELDLFISMGTTGYARSFRRSFDAIDGRSHDYRVGFRFEYPLWNRVARASHERAILQGETEKIAVQNLRQLVELDVREAYIDVNNTRRRIEATNETRKLRGRILEAEMISFRAGKSNNFLVAQAQRDFLQSRLDENEAVVAYLQALVRLYQVDGSLLTRRKLEVQ